MCFKKRKKDLGVLQGADKALANAKSALAEVKSEREEVQEVSSFHREHRMDNHWSFRVEAFLKGNNS